MDIRLIKKNHVYLAKVYGQDTRVRIKKKIHSAAYWSVSYEYLDGMFFGCMKGIQFSETSEFPNIIRKI